MQIL
jgi:hypothetical protein